jgi:hypothetical protein
MRSLDLFRTQASRAGSWFRKVALHKALRASSDQAFRNTDLKRVRAAASALAAIFVGPAFRQFPLRADSSVVKKHSCGVVELPRYSPEYGQNLATVPGSCGALTTATLQDGSLTDVRPGYGHAQARCQGRRVTRATGSGGPGWRLRRIALRQGRKMGWTVQPIFFWFSGLRCKSHH